jgi:hypothetical protein
MRIAARIDADAELGVAGVVRPAIDPMLEAVRDALEPPHQALELAVDRGGIDLDVTAPLDANARLLVLARLAGVALIRLGECFLGGATRFTLTIVCGAARLALRLAGCLARLALGFLRGALGLALGFALRLPRLALGLAL